MKQKVVFFIESLNIGGAEKSLLSLLNNMDSHKYDIDLIVLKKGGKFENLVPNHINYKNINVNIGLLERAKFFLYRKLLSKRHNAQFFWKAIRNKISFYPTEYDIAVGWGQGFATYYTAEKIKAKRKFAWVNTDYQKAGYIYLFDEFIYSEYEKVIAISEHVKTQFEKFIPENKIQIIKNIIDNDEVQQKGNEIPSKSFRKSNLNIVSVGRLVKIKAFDLAIQAAKFLDEKEIDFKWYIIGEGTERSNLELLIQSNNLNDKVILLGFRDNPYPYIKACDIYVQTSKFEGLGRTLIEATILHKPIVTTDFPTAYGLVEDGKTGFITKMEAEKIAEKIMLLYTDKNLYTTMVENLSLKTNNEKQETLSKVYNLFDK